MSGPHPVVLVIEDDPQMRRFLRTSLRSHGFQVFEADTGSRGIIEAGLRRPEVVILDLGLPDMDGVEVVKALREWTLQPIIVLSARSTEEHKIEALDAGADDYLTKPFGIGELIARIRVALRHSAAGAANSANDGYASGGLRIDLLRRTVTVGEREIRLTPTEYRLLAALARHAGKVLTHRQLLVEVWGPSHVEDSHYLRIYMSQLRRKLEADPARPEYLLTESGVGYRLKI
ncbi:MULTISPECIES: response regulator [Methylococcus]|uniref:Response regulator n=1 Tax=Methylococcus capsulatus TaxID=414 RepID=A0ABZ2F6W7_METCP|nr:MULTISPECIES: response regulator [Methylococcus]MDF9392277.1 response regulator [Methylococcus capsulatus]